ncbi:MAG: hypothetical protein ACWGMZ_05895 [Thermoguttaceae bacterium]
MKAFYIRLGVFAVVLFSALPLSADCLSDFFCSIARDTKRRNCWPKPFVCPDRQLVRMPFAVMVHNGWRRQNMLGNFYFESKTGRLKEAGEIKIRWILFEAPQQHRSIYVHTGKTKEETASRMENVQTFVASLIPQNEMPPIMQTSIPDLGSPADHVQLIERKYQATIPAPRLPSQEGENGGMGGGMGQ